MVKKDERVSSTACLLTVRELADYLRLSEAKVYRMANAGLIPAYRVGSSWRFKRERIDDWLTSESEANSPRAGKA